MPPFDKWQLMTALTLSVSVHIMRHNNGGNKFVLLVLVLTVCLVSFGICFD